MNFQLSPIGIVILAGYSVLVLSLIAWPLSKLLRRFAWKWAVIAPPVLVLLALPWAEEAWIAWNFSNACKDAGVHVYRKVEVDGYYDATGGGVDTPGPTEAPSYGRDRFQFIERLIGYDPRANPLRVSHIEKTDGQWQVTILDRPTARYHYRHAYQPTPFRIEEPIGWRLERMETQVVDSETGLVIGRDTVFKRRASTAERLWIRLLGSDLTMCHDPARGPRQPSFPEAVLVPIGKSPKGASIGIVPN